MIERGTIVGLMAALLLFAEKAQAEEKEPSAIVELGAAGEWGLPGASRFGPSAAIEFTPIKNWLEIEAGVSTLFGGGQAEWNTDLLFKKPFTLSDKVEFMVGVGPGWTFTRDGTPERQRSISCSGRRQIESSAGFWSRATVTLSAVGMNNRLE